MSRGREYLLAGLVTVTAALGWLAVQVLQHEAGSKVLFWRQTPLEQVEHLAGKAYVATFDGRAVYRRYPQDPAYFQLLEDGKPLPRPVTSSSAVRRFGAGRYLLRPNGVQFAPVDDSDPRTNGSSYFIDD